jgi:predicted DNA-binding protein (MmcQ/YjbR family)
MPFDSDPAELAHRLRQSYLLVRQGLSRKAQAALPPLAD